MSVRDDPKGSGKISAWEIALFPMLGTLMFVSKVLMASLPNIHLIGMFIMTFTVVFRGKALIPLYLYVFLEGISQGFSLWWIPYLYVWTVLWAVTMLLPRNLSPRIAAWVYPAVCCLHGLTFGTLFAPAQALLMGMNFKAMLAWIAAGFPFDAIHGAGNLVFGLMILPLSGLMKKLNARYGRQARAGGS